MHGASYTATCTYIARICLWKQAYGSIVKLTRIGFREINVNYFRGGECAPPPSSKTRHYKNTLIARQRSMKKKRRRLMALLRCRGCSVGKLFAMAVAIMLLYVYLCTSGFNRYRYVCQPGDRREEGESKYEKVLLASA